MIEISTLKNFFPPAVRDDAHFAKHMLKEYVQLLVLDILSTSPSVRKLAFIGGTSLRLLKGIDRFSEDLDFDCKGLSNEAFMQTTVGGSFSLETLFSRCPIRPSILRPISAA